MNSTEIKKGTVLQNRGDLNSKAYKVLSGLLRSYTIDSKGKEHTFLFAPEGWLIADAIPPEIPGELYIEALEDSTVVALPKDQNLRVVNKEMLVNRMLVLQRRVILLLSATAIERYEHFEATYPEILQRVPQRMIASYLGITPEALSAVKAKRKSATK